MNNITHLIFDWGDTLMFDDPVQSGSMAFWNEVSACDGVPDMLSLLSKKYICAVASNAVDSDAELMKQAFERVGLSQYLTYYITSKELGAKKPESAFFFNAMQVIGAKPSNCTMIGNNYVSDIIGAKKAGMTTILITCESGGEYSLADYVIERFGTLVDILL